MESPFHRNQGLVSATSTGSQVTKPDAGLKLWLWLYSPHGVHQIDLDSLSLSFYSWKIITLIFALLLSHDRYSIKLDDVVDYLQWSHAFICLYLCPFEMSLWSSSHQEMDPFPLPLNPDWPCALLWQEQYGASPESAQLPCESPRWTS